MKKFFILLLSCLFVFSCCGTTNYNFDQSPKNKLDVHDLYNSVAKVSITTKDGSGTLIGTAFAVDEDYLLTAAHVCVGIYEIALLGMADLDEIKLTFLNQEQQKLYYYKQVQIVDIDEDFDLCLLKRKNHKLTPVQFGEYSKLKIGDKVMVLGAPQGVFPVLTEGRVIIFNGAGILPTYYKRGLLTISAPVSGGNSGGPVFDEQGRLVGVLVMGLISYHHCNFATGLDMINKFLGRK